MVISKAELLMQLQNKQQQQQRNKADTKLGIQRDNRRRVDDLKKANRDIVAQGEGAQSLGDAITSGLIMGTGEFLTEQQSKMEAARQWSDWLDNMAGAMERQERSQQLVNNWFAQNYDSLGKFVEQLPNLSSAQAKKGLNVFLDDLGASTGQNDLHLVAFDKENGDVTIKRDNGQCDVFNLYDDYPALKSQATLAKSQRAITDQEIIDAATQEQEIATSMQQAQINEGIRHNRAMEANANAHLDFEKQKYNDQFKAQQQALETDPFHGDKYLNEEYSAYKKNAPQAAKETTAQRIEFDDQTAKILRQSKALDRLDVIRENLPKDNIYMATEGIFAKLRESYQKGNKVSEWISDAVDTFSGVSSEQKKKLKETYGEVLSAMTEFVTGKRQEIAGPGQASEGDMKLVLERAQPLFYNSLDSWKKTFQAFRSNLSADMNTLLKKYDDLRQLENKYNMSPEQFLRDKEKRQAEIKQ